MVILVGVVIRWLWYGCICRFVLMYATVLVNQLTSPLTVAVVGCIKVRLYIFI